MILGDDAVTAMWRYLNSHCEDIRIPKGRIFKYERPEKMADGIYIAINHLPFVRDNVVDSGVVNVNIHVPRTASNEPDTKKLHRIAKCISVLFPNDSVYLEGCYFELYSDSRPTRDNDGTFYVNLKFNVTFNNLKD